MANPGTLTLDGGRIVAAGDWTLASAATLERRAEDLKRKRASGATVDASGVSRLDTAGAELLLELTGDAREGITGLDASRVALVEAVAKAQSDAVAKPPPSAPGIVLLLARTGRA